MYLFLKIYNTVKLLSNIDFASNMSVHFRSSLVIEKSNIFNKFYLFYAIENAYPRHLYRTKVI
jgi:hypothetical protein